MYETVNSHLKKSPPTHTHKLGMKHVIIRFFIGNFQKTNIFNNIKMVTRLTKA